RRPAVGVSPLADKIEILEGQPDRFKIHMTGHARRVRVVFFHSHAHRADVVGLDGRNVRRRIRRGNAEKQRQDHRSALDRRGAVSLRTYSEKTALSEYSGTGIVGIRDSPEFAAGNTWNPVVTRKAIVDEGIVGGPQVNCVVILVDLIFEKQARFSFK